MLVVMDLNGTLLHRPNKRNPSRFVARPHARAFLTYCIDTFHVVIWSSAREANVAAMCADLLSPAQRSRVLAVWGRSRFGLCPADFNRRVQCYKRLTSVWADPAVAAAHPTGGAWDQGNTVLVDDSAEKARSEPFNAVQIPEFVGGGGGDGAAAAAAAGEAGSGDADDALILPRVHDYLNTLACQQDISMYIRANPFRA
ncbi:HAD-like domain-containing protein [Phialemonium atrogriseum]|uniref:Mitochondrial import inner membrane translocase subunit TIM50 n=1 Tax=Phialemonium atrogriseum TaxID=1093897 RepID=A0AAJ0C8G0_9PEZI|nr:HAD-like domain-containing protein [Phialemonium atrogriseum]KAK1770647.1 HAD-like domain-containing protein [Phialemonium atrogriseum]